MGKNASKFDEEFTENYDKNNEKGYILEVTIDYPKDWHDLHSYLPFLPERMKINKCNKPVSNLYDKKTMLFHKKLKTSIRSSISFSKSAQII